MHRILFLLVLVLSPACIEVKAYDPATDAQIQATIQFEEGDYEEVRAALVALAEDEQALKKALKSLDVAHEDEVTRLEAWLASERAKRIEDGDE